ncbi:unnamed protein product, partial [Onchocerca ochengi]|uniref:B box-type domain-containing protein n=1 Tax=Onchocerca ochengi TaxID=42157 RepID=A0A182EA45_ONCOC
MVDARSNFPHNYVTNVNYISAPIPEIRRTMRRFTDINELVNCKGLIDAQKDKTTSLGIYTRIKARECNSKDDIDSLSDSSVEKYACTVCNNKKFCLCASCVNHKVRFLDKHASQKIKEYGKKCLTEEIEKILALDIARKEALHSTHASIEYLKQNILDRKKAIKKKKAALKVMCNKKERYHKTIEELKERCDGHQKVLCGPPSSLKTLVDAYKNKLQKIVKFNAQWFLKIFPIQRVSRPEPIVDDVEKRCREMIAEAWQVKLICGCDTPDRAQYKILKGWLSIGIPAVPVARPVHNMFAAFVYTIQLINLLTVNFDVCIPEQISYQEFSLCRKWTKGLFDTDIFKLNHAIVVLCLSLGIESKLIEPLNPFGNLLLLRNIVDDANSVLK